MRNAVIRSVDIAIFGKVKYREWVWTMSDKLKELLIGKVEIWGQRKWQLSRTTIAKFGDLPYGMERYLKERI